MSRIAYVNGRYVPFAEACVHVEDRGYQFGDGVYEVCEVSGGRLVDERRHLTRLERSLRELRIRPPMSGAALRHVVREVVRRNRIRNGLLYMQVTRGVARRDHMFPSAQIPPALVITVRPIDVAAGARNAERGVDVITVPDNRWERVDIKSIALLPNVLARQAAAESGAAEAWFVDGDGYVTEGSSSNAWIVDRDGRLITRPADGAILRGITRTVVEEIAAQEGIEVIERPFTVDEARQAREAFITSATKLVMPVVRIDDAVIGNGHPGSIARRLREVFRDHAELCG